MKDYDQKNTSDKERFFAKVYEELMTKPNSLKQTPIDVLISTISAISKSNISMQKEKEVILWIEEWLVLIFENRAILARDIDFHQKVTQILDEFTKHYKVKKNKGQKFSQDTL